ncbi:MAG: hypothetical protein O2798_01490 [Chloroflexi bacterium]|nr:hypothetical protein [Chloroflexota bacterium]MDA1239493.1 hypothetical protein [Chloroflexota bacterium]
MVSTSLSLILIATGAILTWGVVATVAGLDLKAIGVILMVVGTAGLVLSLVFWNQYSPFIRRTRVIEVQPDPIDRVI